MSAGDGQVPPTEPWPKPTPPCPVPDEAFQQAMAAAVNDANAVMAEATARVREGLHQLHLQHSMNPIKLADPNGLFPDAAIHDVPPVVVDANTIRNDVIYACRHGRTITTLVTAANSGLIRLFCAGHVLDEIDEHCMKWCRQAGVSIDEFGWLLDHHYAPLLRVVENVPDGLLSREEQARLDRLRLEDADDIPSVTLALLLGAFFMSEDGPAAAAVYGVAHSDEELRAWREVLRAGGDAGMLRTAFEGAALLVGLFGSGIWNLFDHLTRALPAWTRVIIAAGLSLGTTLWVRSWPDERKRSLGDVLGAVAQAIAVLSTEHIAAMDRLRRAQPALPSWDQLASDRYSNQVLVRACLHTLARTRQSDRSAAELAEVIPWMPVAQGEAKVRAVLRETPCFIEVYKGRWQLGEALVRAPIDIVDVTATSSNRPTPD